MSEIRNLLDDVIETKILDFSNSTNGIDEDEKTLEEIERLHKMRIEELKVENESKFKSEQLRIEEDKNSNERFIKLDQINSEKLETFINAAVTIGSGVGSWLLYRKCFRDGLKFEETGSLTSPWMRNLISKLIPKK